MRLWGSTLLLIVFYVAAAAGDCSDEMHARDTSVSAIENQILSHPVTQIQFPYPMTPTLPAQIIPLGMRLPAYPSARLNLTYFPVEQSLIPAYGNVESWHAIVRYFRGFVYVLNFSEKEERAKFLKTYSQVHEHEGQFEDETGNTRYALFLTPAQLLEMQKQIEVVDRNAAYDDFAPSSWNEINDLGVDHQQSTRNTVYFFDKNSNVIGMLRGRKYYRALAPNGPKGLPYASHAAILARQRALNLGASAPVQMEVDTLNYGLDEGVRVIDEKMTLIDNYLKAYHADLFERIQQNEQKLLGVLNSSAAVTEAFSKTASSLYFVMSKYRQDRIDALKLYTKAFPEDYIVGDVYLENTALYALPSGDIQKLPAELRKDLSARYRFLWLKGLAPERGGLILSKSGNLLHQQMLQLVYGKAIGGVLHELDVVRGGAINIKYDSNGKALSADVFRGDIRLMNTFGSAHIINMKPAEKMNLEMSLRTSFITTKP